MSLDVALDSDQSLGDGFISAMSQKNRRKAAKKSKASDHTDNGSDNRASLSSQDLSSPNAPIDVCNSKVQADVQDVTVTVEPNCDRRCSVSENIITSLMLEVKELNEKVKTLTTQVETLTASVLASSCTPTLTQSPPTQTCAIADTPNITSVPIKYYATITANSIGVQQVHQQIHRNMVSAVYVDLEEKRIVCCVRTEVTTEAAEFVLL